MWSTEVQAREVLTPPQTIMSSVYGMHTHYILFIICIFFFFFLGSLMFIVALTLEISRVLSFSLSFDSLGCILLTVFCNLVRKGFLCVRVLGENKSMPVIHSQNAEGKQLSPPP